MLFRSLTTEPATATGPVTVPFEPTPVDVSDTGYGERLKPGEEGVPLHQAFPGRYPAPKPGPVTRPAAPPPAYPTMGGFYHPHGGAPTLEEAETDLLADVIGGDIPESAEERELARLRKYWETVPRWQQRRGVLQLEGLEAQEQAAKRIGEAAASGYADTIQAAQEQQAWEQGERQAQQQRLQAKAEVEAEFEERQAEADRRVQEFRIGDKRDVGTRIFHGVAAALGALGAGLAKMPNFALQSIEKSIDRDIAAQERELSKREKGAAMVRNDLAAYRSAFASEEQARDMLRASYYREYQGRFAEIAASTQSAVAQAKLAEVGLLLENRREDLTLQQKIGAESARLSLLVGAGKPKIGRAHV